MATSTHDRGNAEMAKKGLANVGKNFLLLSNNGEASKLVIMNKLGVMLGVRCA